MLKLCRSKTYDDYVFVSPKSGGRLTDVQRAFRKACTIARIDGLVWHDLRATFGTRLGEADSMRLLSRLFRPQQRSNYPALC